MRNIVREMDRMTFPENIKSNEDILDAFKLVVPYINHVVREELAVGVTSTKEFLEFDPGAKLRLNIEAGKPISGGIANAIASGRDIAEDLPESVHGDQSCRVVGSVLEKF